MKDFKKLIKEAHLGNPLNEELKLGVKYELPTGETGYILTGGSKDPKDWKFSGNKESYLSVKDKLKPTEKQPGKYDGVDFMDESVDEGTCGYTPDGEPRSKPASPSMEEDLEVDVSLYSDDSSIFSRPKEKATVNIPGDFNDNEGEIAVEKELRKQNKLFKSFKVKDIKELPDLNGMEEGNGGAEQDDDQLSLNVSSDGDLDNAVSRMGYAESLKKSLKEALNKRLGK